MLINAAYVRHVCTFTAYAPVLSIVSRCECHPGFDNVTLQLLQELDQHMSYVNTLCFNKDGSLLYSGDSSGSVCVWNIVIEDGACLSGITFFRF